jgi:hypothetical protein
MRALPKDPAEDYLDLTLLEVYIVATMLSHGIPTWSSTGLDEALGGAGAAAVASHDDFLSVLKQAHRSCAAAGAVGRIIIIIIMSPDPSREVEHRPSQRESPRKRSKRYGANAAGNSSDLVVLMAIRGMSPRELAKRVVMLLASVVEQSGCSISEAAALPKSRPNGLLSDRDTAFLGGVVVADDWYRPGSTAKRALTLSAPLCWLE